MDVIQAIKGRRSIRRYKPDPVDEATLNRVLEAARWAPSWANTQCWRFIIVRDARLKDGIVQALSAGVPGRNNAAANALRQAPVVIVACAQRRVSGFFRSGERQGQPATDKEGYWFMFDLALAMQNLTLAAYALGLGTVHVGLFDVAAVARLLSVPEDVAVVEVMPLGYPDEAPPARPRKELQELVFYEGYGLTQPRS